MWKSNREISVHSQTVAIAAGVRKLLQELRKGKARQGLLAREPAVELRVLGGGSTCWEQGCLTHADTGWENAVNSKGADSIKLFRLVKTSASCKDCWKTKQHTVGGIKKADYVQHR